MYLIVRRVIICIYKLLGFWGIFGSFFDRFLASFSLLFCGCFGGGSGDVECNFINYSIEKINIMIYNVKYD